jgi:hypothetical protein
MMNFIRNNRKFLKEVFGRQIINKRKIEYNKYKRNKILFHLISFISNNKT